MTLTLFRPTFCFLVVVGARHGIPLGAAESTEEDASSRAQFQAAMLQSFAPDVDQGGRACQQPTGALPASESKCSAPQAKEHVAAAPSWAVSTTCAFLGVVLKLLTCAVVIDGLVRWFRPQESAASKSCEKCISKTSNMRDSEDGVAQKLGSPSMGVLFAIPAVSTLVLKDSELLVALIGGGLYLVCVWAMADAPKKFVPAKKLAADDDDDDVDEADDADDDKNDQDDAQQEKKVVEDRLLAELKLEHEADVYVPLWQSSPQAWSLLLS